MVRGKGGSSLALSSVLGGPVSWMGVVGLCGCSQVCSGLSADCLLPCFFFFFFFGTRTSVGIKEPGPSDPGGNLLLFLPPDSLLESRSKFQPLDILLADLGSGVHFLSPNLTSQWLQFTCQQTCPLWIVKGLTAVDALLCPALGYGDGRGGSWPGL